jgi:hypothetical protein
MKKAVGAAVSAATLAGARWIGSSAMAPAARTDAKLYPIGA